MNNGFKKTKIGYIPIEWDTEKLKEITFINKKLRNPTKEIPNEYFVYIDINSIEGGSGVIKETKTILGKDAPSRARRVVYQNDVIMSTVRPYLKAFTIIPNEYNNQICSTGFAVLTCKEKIFPKFLLYCLFSTNFITQCNKMMVGGLYPALNTTQVGKLLVPLPPIFEQQKIAEILSTVDEAIQKVEEVIQRTERLKQGLMQELLTKGIKYNQFKDKGIGWIPEDWEVKELREMGILKYGYTQTAKEDGNGIKYLRITDINDNGNVDWSKVPYCEISKEDFKKYQLKRGNILFARIGSTTGKTCFIDKEINGVFASYLIRFQSNSNALYPEFLFYFTHSQNYWSQVNRFKEAILKKGINAVFLSKLQIPVPPISEQQKIIEILSSIDKKIEFETNKKEKFTKIKSGLMNELLTGRKRVKIGE